MTTRWSERAAHRLNPGHPVHGWADHCEVEPVARADVAVVHLADMQGRGRRRSRAGPRCCDGRSARRRTKARPRPRRGVPLRWLTVGELGPAGLPIRPRGRTPGARRRAGRACRWQARHAPVPSPASPSPPPGQGAPGGPKALKPEHRPCPALDPAVVLLDQVVEPLPAPVPGEASQPALPFHLAKRAGVALEPIGRDNTRKPAGDRDRPAQGPPCWRRMYPTAGCRWCPGRR